MLEEHAVRDGFSYMSDLLRVLCCLYGSGRISKLFGKQAKALVSEWRAWSPADMPTTVRKLIRIQDADYARAVTRWRAEQGEDSNAHDVFVFLVWAYAMKKINLGISANAAER